MWTVYILLCDNRAYYTGLTKDLERRLRDHMEGKGGKYTKRFTHVELVYTEEHDKLVEAQRRESQIKGWSRAKKAALIDGQGHELSRFSRSKKPPDD